MEKYLSRCLSYLRTMNHVADKLQNPVTVRVERRRARRYPCVVSIELADLQSDFQLQERVTDLSLMAAVWPRVNPFPWEPS